MKKKSIKYQILILGTLLVFAVLYPLQSVSQNNSSDTTKRFSSFLKEGELKFLSRTQVMSTINEGNANDFFTIGTGAGVFYKTPTFYGFKIKAGAFMSFRLAEYNLMNTATKEWNNSRYEKALYDIKNVNNKYHLAALDELFLSYTHKRFSLKLGRQIHETPLLNKNFNRFRPNIFQGISVKYQDENLMFSGAWFTSEAIRGTMNTYSSGNSFGVYSQGSHPNGSKNDYHGYISSLGTGVFGIKYKHKNWETQAWNYLSENVFNISFLQSEYTLKKNRTEFLFGVQGFYQTALNTGGNSNSGHSYMLKDEQTFALGGRIGIKIIQQHEFSFNYLGISDEGRFLFPREWGREQFYASQTTELFEGYGGLNAYVLRYKYYSKNKQHISIISSGIIDQPSIENFRLNKYALDNYYHFLIEHKYQFSNYMKGLSLRFIATYKKEIDQGTMTTHQKLNKVNMINLNLVVDYKF